MFKVGDIVEITEESDATGMLEFKTGKGYVVQDFRVAKIGIPTAQVYVCGEGNSCEGWYAASHFKLKEEVKVEKKECLFKKGQVVWHLTKGKVIVEDVDEAIDPTYPVKVRYEDGDYDFYTGDGKLVETDKLRSLYFSEPKIEAATEPVFEPMLKKGDLVVVVEKNSHGKGFVIKVYEESVCYVENDCETKFNKDLFDFYRIGEKIEFN